MKKIFTLIFIAAVCISSLPSCSKHVQKPTDTVVVSNASTKTGTTTSTTTTTQTTNTTQTTSGHTCGGSGSYGGNH